MSLTSYRAALPRNKFNFQRRDVSSLNAHLCQLTKSSLWTKLFRICHFNKLLVIRPGIAFGTGRHESTQLCAQGIQSLENPETKNRFCSV
ncbi:MAG: 50S ribosomal protein L11 methyltransferase [Deltaproteobacteria bacterium]|nr:50S ribosomal protein L11 methyltransferase [Deltaproteobacteria bacterium]